MNNWSWRISWSVLAAIVVVWGVPRHAHASSDTSSSKEPAAMEILKRADIAIRELDTIAFHAEFEGLWWARGRVEGHVRLRRGAEIDPQLQQRYYDALVSINNVFMPAANEGFPEEFQFIMRGKDAWLVDEAGRRVIYASGLSRARMLNAGTTIVLPQYYRIDPLKPEMEQTSEVRLVGQDMIDGVACNVVYLKFPDEAGFGEQLLYFGVEDHLLRKATLVTRDVPGIGPAGMMQTTMSDVQVDIPLPDRLFAAPKASGYKFEEFEPQKVAIGDVTPDWTVDLHGGGTISATDLQGEPAVIVFWASWCPSCHAFFPELEDMAEKYQDEGVRFIAINVWDTDDPNEFIDEHNPSFEIGLEGSHVADAYRFIGQPAVVVLDEKGIIQYKQLGARPATDGNPRIWAAIDSILDK